MVALLIEDQEGITKRLFELGYLWDIKQQELLDLAPGDTEFKTAVLEMQNTFRDEYELSHGLHHDKVFTGAGDAGPAFMDVLNTPRMCPLPDTPPPPGVKFAYDDPDLQLAVESQQIAAAISSDSEGSGSWPHGCWSNEGFDMHRLVVAVKHSSMPTRWRTEWPWLIEQCRINYSWTGLRIDFVNWGDKADVFLQFRGGGPWIGLAQFPTGKCTDEVFLYIKSSYQPSNRRYMLNLLQHELGHNSSLQHTRGNWIMNPTINLADHDWRNDTHWKTLKRYYGGEGSPDILRDDKVPPTDPKPPTAPRGAPNGTFVTPEGDLYKIWTEKVKL